MRFPSTFEGFHPDNAMVSEFKSAEPYQAVLYQGATYRCRIMVTNRLASASELLAGEFTGALASGFRWTRGNVPPGLTFAQGTAHSIFVEDLWKSSRGWLHELKR